VTHGSFGLWVAFQHPLAPQCRHSTTYPTNRNGNFLSDSETPHQNELWNLPLLMLILAYVTPHLLVEAVHISHGAATARRGRLGVEPIQCFIHEKDAWASWATNEFVRTQKDRIIPINFTGLHVDLDIWATIQNDTSQRDLVMEVHDANA
jgi:hypothetical protein